METGSQEDVARGCGVVWQPLNGTLMRLKQEYRLGKTTLFQRFQVLVGGARGIDQRFAVVTNCAQHAVEMGLDQVVGNERVRSLDDELVRGQVMLTYSPS